MSTQEFQADDPEEMFQELLAIAEWDTIQELVEDHLPNDGDDLAEICARGLASMKRDTQITQPVL